MKDVRFYLEYPNAKAKRVPGTKSGHNGTVIAVFTGVRSLLLNGCYEAVGAVYFEPNSPVCGTQVSPAYLQAKCKRVGEDRARAIHPRLFTYLSKEN